MESAGTEAPGKMKLICVLGILINNKPTDKGFLKRVRMCVCMHTHACVFSHMSTSTFVHCVCMYVEGRGKPHVSPPRHWD